MKTVYDAFAVAVARWPDLPFMAVLPETAAAYAIAPGEISYAEAARRVDALCAQWAGYGAGHRVGLLLENRPEFFLTWFALNRLGLSVVPINPDLRAAELEYLLAHSEAVAVVAIPARIASIAAAAQAAGCAVAVLAPGEAPPPAPCPGSGSECALLYTSGTTGRPKGCVLPDRYFIEAGLWYSQTGGLIAMHPGQERMLTPLPAFHMNAMAYSAMAMILTGGCLIILDRFHPRTWWESVRASRATIVHYLGVMPAMLMGAPAAATDRSHQVRFGFGAGVPPALHQPFEARFGFPLIEAWAMTETGAGAVVAATAEPRHAGTNCFGRPVPPIQTRIVDEHGADAPVEVPGELLVRRAGPDPRAGFFAEYLKDSAATEAAWAGGWFHTGDVVRQGDDGALYFVDRRKNVIRRSGENIAAVEVEGVLLQHPAIRAVAVAARPDPVRGDEVFACIVAHQSPQDDAARSRLAGEVVAHCLSRLAYYKAPGWVAFVPALPLTATQKVQRGEMKFLVASLAGDPAVVDTRKLKKRTA